MNPQKFQSSDCEIHPNEKMNVHTIVAHLLLAHRQATHLIGRNAGGTRMKFRRAGSVLAHIRANALVIFIGEKPTGYVAVVDNLQRSRVDALAVTRKGVTSPHPNNRNA